MDEILIDKIAFKGFCVEHDFPTIGQKIMILNARIIHLKDKNESIILLAIEDITDIKTKENELKERTMELQKKTDELNTFLTDYVDHDLRMTELKTIINGLHSEIESLRTAVICKSNIHKKKLALFFLDNILRGVALQGNYQH